MKKLYGYSDSTPKVRDFAGASLARSSYRRDKEAPLPLSIPGLEFWVSTRFPSSLLQIAGDVSSKATGDPIGYWQDQSTNGRNLTQTTGSLKPTIKLQAINGQNSVIVDNTDDRLDSPTIPRTITGTQIEVTKYGINVFKATAGDSGNTTFYINSFLGQSELLDKLFYSTNLTQLQIDQLVAYFKPVVPYSSYSSLTTLAQYWKNRVDFLTFPFIDTKQVTNLYQTWFNCNKMTSFPLINTSNVTNFSSTWQECRSIKEFPLIDTSKTTGLASTWVSNYALTGFPSINTSAVTTISNCWLNCIGLVSFPLLDTSNVTNFTYTWGSCSSLKSFPLIDTSKATTLSGTWSGCSGLTSFPAISPPLATVFSYAWENCSGLTSFPAINTSSGTTYVNTWINCTGLTSFPTINTASAITLQATWQGCTGLTSFPLLTTSNATSMSNAWNGCTGLTSFPQLDTSKVTNFTYTWNGCSGLTSFPTIDTSQGTDFSLAWAYCSNLTSFPALNMSKSIKFQTAWYHCDKLADFPANMFDTCNCTNYSYSFQYCALTQTSVDNIFNSIAKSAVNLNLTSGILNMNAGTSSAPGHSGYYGKNALVKRGWTVTNNGTDPTPDYALIGATGLTSGEAWSVGYFNLPKAAVWAFYYN